MIFSIGNTTIKTSASWRGNINSNGNYNFKLDLVFSLYDEFIDVADFNDLQPGNQELGGDPYTFSGKWLTHRDGNGYLE